MKLQLQSKTEVVHQPGVVQVAFTAPAEPQAEGQDPTIQRAAGAHLGASLPLDEANKLQVGQVYEVSFKAVK